MARLRRSQPQAMTNPAFGEPGWLSAREISQPDWRQWLDEARAASGGEMPAFDVGPSAEESNQLRGWRTGEVSDSTSLALQGLRQAIQRRNQLTRRNYLKIQDINAGYDPREYGE